MQNQSSFLQQVAVDLKNRFGDDISDIAVIFNNNRPITYLKKYLADVYQKAFWSPHFFTIQDFFESSSSLEPAGQITQFFYLYELHNQLLEKEGLQAETLEEFFPIGETILSDFGQIDYELVPVDHIYTALFDTTRIDVEFGYLSEEQQKFLKEFWASFNQNKQTNVQIRFLKLWKRLPALYKAFKNKLTEKNQTNFPTLYRNLAENNPDIPSFIHPYKKLVFVGFNALNKAEETLFKKWQAEGKALFYFDCDAYYLDDNLQEAGLFIRKNIFKTKLDNALGEAKSTLAQRTEPVHLYSSLGEVSQTKLLHGLLQKQDPKDNSSSAILLADENLLIPLLQSLPEHVSKNINITAGFPLTQSPLYGIFDLWMKVHEEISFYKKKKIPYQWLDIFINHPLTKVSEQEKQDIQGYLYEKQLYEIEIEQINIETSTLPHFFKAISDSDKVIPTLIQLIRQLLTASEGDTQLKRIHTNLLIETQKTLNQLELGLQNLPIQSILFLMGLIRRVLGQVKSAIEGDPLRGTQVIGLLESRCLNFDNIYILGANEGVLPNTSPSLTFLPNNLRKAYGLPILENQDALSAYLFYRQFQYSKNIHVFYNSLMNQNSSGEESRFIKQLQFESSIPFIEHRQSQKVQAPPKYEELIIEKKGKVWNKMFESYIVKQKKISATALTTYLQSPLQFFLKYIAEIQEPPRIHQEFEMNTLGTVVHNVMESILLPYKNKDSFTSTSILKNELKNVSNHVLQEICRQYQEDFENLEALNSMQKIMHKIAEEYVKIYLQHDIHHYNEFKIIELENDEDYTLQFPIQINGKEEYITLFGIIDRVDQVVHKDGEIQTRIVDYKTGGDCLKFTDFKKMFGDKVGNKPFVQTLFYSYVFEKCTNYKNLEPHLYVARKMREEGTLFNTGKNSFIHGEKLVQLKEEFEIFLKETLEEIFNPEIPFKHNPEAEPYPNDPYLLFYTEKTKTDDED